MLYHGWLNHAVTGGARHKHTRYKEPGPHCFDLWRTLDVHIYYVVVVFHIKNRQIRRATSKQSIVVKTGFNMQLVMGIHISLLPATPP